MIDIRWEESSSYWIANSSSQKLEFNSKIAAFDLDHTLIKPLGDRVFSKNMLDWRLYNKKVKEKIKKLHDEQYLILIVSNQKNLNADQKGSQDFKAKIQLLSSELETPFIIFVSLKDDMYRKPRIQFWKEFIRGDLKNSFYCGDAGGLTARRINKKFIPKDFSDSDLKFALNIGIPFLHRDEFVFDLQYKPDKYVIKYPFSFSQIKIGNDDTQFLGNHPEVLILVGFPGSGKTHFAKNIIKSGFGYINADTMGTIANCLSAFEEKLKDGCSVIVDNTNLTVEIRKRYIDIAKTFGFKIRCLFFNTPFEICRHNNILRNYLSNNKISIIPKIAYYKFKKILVEPTLDEGFYKIEEHNFKLDEKVVRKIDYFQYME